MSYIIDSIRQHAQQQPHAIAISSAHLRVTYAQLDQAITALAAQLTLKHYQCIGLLADNSINWALIDLACLQAGICCVPIPPFFSRQQMQHLCESAGIQALMGDADSIVGCTANQTAPYRLLSHGIAIQELTGQTMAQHGHLGIAKITFTSGSTGTPKGVCLSPQHIENTVKALDQAIGRNTSKRHLSALPLVTLLENIAGLYLSLVQGAEILLYPMSDIGFSGLASIDEKQFFHMLNTSRPQSLILVPELLRLLMLGAQHQLISTDSFSFIAVGGGKVSETLIQQAAALGLPVLQGYGLSECASVVSLNTFEDNKPGSVGKALSHVEIKIADDGEILIAGNLMAGYLGEAHRQSQWLASGDIGHVDDDGYLYVTGRKNNLLITAFGKNISPEWVESIFLQSPMIRQIMVSGDASTHLHAIIVPTTTLDADHFDSIIADINRQLPDYARVRDYRISTTPFLFENGLLTANGRMKRAAIAAHYA